MEWMSPIDQLPATASLFWQAFPTQKIFAFSGNLGAGKTTLIQALCRSLKVQDVVTSPTFSIINEYRYPKGIIYHIDLYRLRDSDEALQAGVGECLESGELCFVEWPSIAADLLPEYTVFIELESLDPLTRKIRVATSGLPEIQL